MKGTMLEGGSRVPFIANWKGVTPEGGELYDMSHAPFEEKLVSAGSESDAAKAATTRLKAALDTLSPATGKTAAEDTKGPGAKRRAANQGKGK